MVFSQRFVKPPSVVKWVAHLLYYMGASGSFPGCDQENPSSFKLIFFANYVGIIYLILVSDQVNQTKQLV